MGEDQRKPISKSNKGYKIKVLNSEKSKNLHLHVVHLRIIVADVVFGACVTDALVLEILELYT